MRKFGCVHGAIHGDGRLNLQRILKTCEEMLRDRGCREVVITRNVLQTITSQTTAVLSGRGGREIDVYITAEDKVGVKLARSLLEATTPNRQVVVVSFEGATPFTRKECGSRLMQFMRARELCMNVTRHCLVPHHEVVKAPPEGMRAEQLPLLLETDPVVQYYNWPSGTVVRIERRFGGHEIIPYYRVVAAAMS